ncbi:MAG TPA: hypothetical protein VGQ19_02085 [Burkholderiales bacterium]|jgi:hypothetical protein|nr:hypothetical protein [Burkholderiales bacterium]
MSQTLRLLWVAIVLLELTACASTKKEPGPPPPKVEAPATENLLHDKTVIPGVRAGPMFLDMPLRQLIEVFGEPVSGTDSRMPGGRPALLYRYPDPGAEDGAVLVLVRENDQTVYSIEIERIESFQTREGVRFGSSEALVRASFGKPQSMGEMTVTGHDGATAVMRMYCYLSGLGVRLDTRGNVEALTVFPGSDLRKICKAQ